MSSAVPRYAIYFVPPADSVLYRFGSAVLGYDAYSGENVSHLPGFEAGHWRDIVREPRIYGFHATLKAPFALVDGADEAGLIAAANAFAKGRESFAAGRLAVRELGSFIALVPEAACPPLDGLAADCVRAFDLFRAPLDGYDRSRRLKSPLTPSQVENLDRWGYPYVFEEFRFHMTLTGALPDGLRKKTFSTLRDNFAAADHAQELRVTQIVVVRQSDRNASFRVVAIIALRGSVTAA
ncbi:MAG: DUF1045 domain-containing protein [Pseudolabrys sp.]